jgi:hypothetical protein
MARIQGPALLGLAKGFRAFPFSGVFPEFVGDLRALRAA